MARDLTPALNRLVVAAARDEALRPADRIVLDAECAAALKRGSIEIMAGREWLARQTGLSERAVRTSVKRLELLGYHERVRLDQVTDERLRGWIARKYPKGGRPAIVRLSGRQHDEEEMARLGFSASEEER